MRLWVLAHEMIGHALFSITSLRDDYAALVRRHVGAFQPDPSAVAEKLTDLDMEGGDPMQAIQRALADPAMLLGAVQSPEQAALAPSLDAATAAIIGYVDYLVDAVAARVIGGEALRIAEAVRRRRVEASPDDLYIERLLGLKLTHEQVQRGKTFIAGVVDRVGEAALERPVRPPGRPADAHGDRRPGPLARPPRPVSRARHSHASDLRAVRGACRPAWAAAAAPRVRIAAFTRPGGRLATSRCARRCVARPGA